MNYFEIISIWITTRLEYSEDLTTSIDITHFMKKWDIILWSKKDKIGENRKIINIIHSHIY